MQIDWNDKDPIYRQLHEQLVALILDGILAEGEPLPSIREISSQQRINHITVAKAIGLLVDAGLVEKRRGTGMFVMPGARKALLRVERERFLRDEWPQLLQKLRRLDLDIEDLLDSTEAKENNA